ncbi:MAG: NAD(P)/FAD-dependent oxidoreductase [Pseudomonadota bacterium]|nr:NAD(P)/FAD-dependent oxidoreductase [Pseudomonadota bacterium]
MHDIVIIGAGPAGLTAATYLGRFRRQALVIDGEASRARWIPKSRNMPGFSQGVGGPELLAQLRLQAVRYGAHLRPGHVQSLRRIENGLEVHLGTDTLESRFVLLATGVRDHLPPLPGVAEAVLRSVVRVCPICDGFEATGKNIAVISDNDRGAAEAEFLTTYSDRVTLISTGDITEVRCKKLDAAGIQVVRAGWAQLELSEAALHLHSPEHSMTFEAVYSALGCTPLDRLASDLGAELDADHALVVDAHQKTSVPFLYAAGDVVRGLNQIAVAAAEGAIAATDIHNQLRKN